MCDLESSVIDSLVDISLDDFASNSGSLEFIGLCAAELQRRRVLLVDELFFPAYSPPVKPSAADTPQKHSNGLSRKYWRCIKGTVCLSVIIFALFSGVISTRAFRMSTEEAIEYIASQPPGTVFDIGEHTFYRPGDERYYNTIEEMVEKENLDIMYPHAYPDNFDIKEICISSDYKAELFATISTYNPHVVIAFSIGIDSPPVSIVNRETYTVGDNMFVLLEQDVEGIYNAICQKNGTDYYISVEGYENLIYVLDNFKE